MWKHGTIGDVLCVMQNGVNCKQNKSGQGLKITRIETISEAKINYEKTGFAYLNEIQKEKAELKKGDILFSHINSSKHVGKTAIYYGEEPLYHGINLLRLNTIEDVDNSYFNYFLCSLFWNGYWKRTAKQSINQASVNQEDIRRVSFSYPILSEQQRIVAKLDTVFAEIEKSLISKKLKFDFLKKLEDKIVCDVFKYYSEKKSIEDVTMKTSTINMNKKYPTKSFQYVDVSSVNKENLRIEKTQKLLGINAPSRARRQIQEGDVIFATIRPTLKRIAIVPKELNGQICSTGFSVLRGKKEILDNKYLFYILSSSITLRYMNTLQTGASYPAVTDKQMKEFMIPIPPIETQREIADRFENIISEINKAKSLIYEVLKSYDSLKNSLLTNELAIK